MIKNIEIKLNSKNVINKKIKVTITLTKIRKKI